MYELNKNDKKFNISTEIDSKIKNKMFSDLCKDSNYGWDYKFNISSNFILNDNFDIDTKFLATMGIKFKSKTNDESFEDLMFLDIDDLTNLRNLIDEAITKIQHQKEKMIDNFNGMRSANLRVLKSKCTFYIDLELTEDNTLLMTLKLKDSDLKLYQIECDMSLLLNTYFSLCEREKIKDKEFNLSIFQHAVIHKLFGVLFLDTYTIESLYTRVLFTNYYYINSVIVKRYNSYSNIIL